MSLASSLEQLGKADMTVKVIDVTTLVPFEILVYFFAERCRLS